MPSNSNDRPKVLVLSFSATWLAQPTVQNRKVAEELPKQLVIDHVESMGTCKIVELEGVKGEDEVLPPSSLLFLKVLPPTENPLCPRTSRPWQPNRDAQVAAVHVKQLRVRKSIPFLAPHVMLSERQLCLAVGGPGPRASRRTSPLLLALASAAPMLRCVNQSMLGQEFEHHQVISGHCRSRV